MHLDEAGLPSVEVQALLGHVLGASTHWVGSPGAQLEQLVSAFQARGAITDEVSAQEAALTLYGTFCTSTMVWVMLPDQGLAELCEGIDRQLHVVLRGLEPRDRRRKR